MQIKNVLTGLVGLAVLADAASIERRSPFGRTLERRQNQNGRNRGGNNGGNNGNNGNNNAGNNGGNNGGNAGGATLDSNLIQTGSQQDGNNPGADGQSASATDNFNFINFCQGKTITNGEQVRTGSCNGIPMGNIPATTNMVSSVFVNPQDGDNLNANTDFNIQVQMINFAPGTFTNATSTYYAAPQDIDGNGNIIGHTHVTVQSTGNSLNPTQPLDPTQFVFFKGINDAGNGQGLLSATVTGGLPAGNYRVCSMSSAANHQPVLMPVAQRGAQDDCVRFTVGGNGNNNNGGNANNGNANNGNANNGNANNGNANNGNANNGNANNGQGAGNTNNAGQANNGQNGIAAPPVTQSGNQDRPFEVEGNTFTTKNAAIQRACDIQSNQCANAVNGQKLSGVTVADCTNQIAKC
ncbi:uncharacterized protein TRIVIDRAFT_117265, partial [Trichoderma virens Gv29-8]